MNTSTIKRTALKILKDQRGSLSEWRGRCYAAVLQLQHRGLGTARYGLWWGPVCPEARMLFTVTSVGNCTFSPHGWLDLEDGRVCDPTRWAFGGADPYLYIGAND